MKTPILFIAFVFSAFTITSCAKSDSEKIAGSYTGTYSSDELGGAGTGTAKVISVADKLVNIEFKVNGYDPKYINDINITVSAGTAYTLSMVNPATNANFQGTVVMGILGITNDMLTINYSSDNFGLQFNGYKN